jgi:hypothetical protein
MSRVEESRGFANGESEAGKLSRGLVSGGDIRLETEGRRCIVDGCLAGCQPADEVIPD